MFVRALCGVACGAVLSLFAAPALAAVAIIPVNVDVSTMPFTYDFGGGSTLTFDSDASGFASAYGIQTGGSTQVFSVFGQPSLFQPFATSAFPSQQLGSFASYATETAVNFSLSEATLGFKFTLADGDHFGLAKTDGTLIGALYVQQTPGADIGLSVPEPATWALLMAGFGGIGVALRRRRLSPSPSPYALA